MLEILAIAIRQEKEIKGTQAEKEVKLFIFTNDMFYMKELKDFTRKLLETMNTFINVTWCKINL